MTLFSLMLNCFILFLEVDHARHIAFYNVFPVNLDRPQLQLSATGFSGTLSDSRYSTGQQPGFMSLGDKLADLAAVRAGLATNNQDGLFMSAYPGEIYTDVRMESDKKNLLTLPTDPNRMYIKPARSAPSAEVIVYPMGQLLGGQSQQQHQQQKYLYPPHQHDSLMGQQQQDTMAVAGTSEIEIAQDGRVVVRGGGEHHVASAGGKSVKMAGGEGGGGDPPPQGLLQTLVRSAKDDLKIVGNVFKHLTGAVVTRK